MSVDMEAKLIENLMVSHYNNLEAKMDLVAERAAEKVVMSVVPKMQQEIIDNLKNTLQKMMDANTCKTTLELTGEEYSDANARKRVRDSVQWAIRSANRTAIVVRGALLASTGGVVGSIVAMLLRKG